MSTKTTPFDQAEQLTVQILDLSGAAMESDNVVEEIKGFADLAHANAFARAYVRDSVERCRVPGASEKDVLSAWFAFGEDAVIPQPVQGRWQSASELNEFACSSAPCSERDWRSIDPRRHTKS